MSTKNPNLESLTIDNINKISERYLLGWHDLEHDFGFRLKGLNHVREKFDMEPLTKEMSDKYRVSYIRANYTQDQILLIIRNYLESARVDKTRWSGIELFGCRFGGEYARLFKVLVGSSVYRDLSEEMRRKKSIETQIKQYGGVGLAGESTKAKALITVQNRYGVDNVMQDAGVKNKLAVSNMIKYGSVSPFGNVSVQIKSMDMKLKNIQDAMRVFKQTDIVDRHLFRQSPQEFYVASMLFARFGKSDVFYQYGIHPSDRRYPYNCDFYIRSLDLFIELNGHYSHGGHWFDPSNHDDQLRVSHLIGSGSKRAENAVKVWTVVDPEKRLCAKRSGIRYLVFWDGRSKQVGSERVPVLSDFKEWFHAYNADYDAFIADFPENTY